MVAVGWTRTNDLLVMSQTSYQLLHPAWLRRQDSNLRFLTYEDSEIVHFSTPQWRRYLQTTENFLVCAQGVLSLHYIAGGFI